MNGQNSLAEKEVLRCGAEQIVAKLRQADVALGKGHAVKEVCRNIEVSEQTYCRWDQKYGGMSPELAILIVRPFDDELAAMVALGDAAYSR